MKRLLFLLLPFALLLGACAANPVNTAQTVEQKAAALYGQFVIAEQAAAAVVCPGRQNLAPGVDRAAVPCNPTAPAGVVKAVATVDAIAKPLADTLATAARQYAVAKAEVDAATRAGGQPTGQAIAAVTIGLQNLTKAYEEAGPSIRALIAAIKSHADKD